MKQQWKVMHIVAIMMMNSQFETNTETKSDKILTAPACIVRIRLTMSNTDHRHIADGKCYQG